MADEFPVAADKLRKLIKKSRQMPISFGFNAGTSDDDDEYLAAHARKAPEILGKIAKTEGAGNKSAYGTFVAEGSEIHLTCFQTIPQLAKKFKKYLKVNKITLNVVVMDPDGNIIDSDVEVLENWTQDEGEDDEDEGEEIPVAPPRPQQAATPRVPPSQPPQQTATPKVPPVPPPQPTAQPPQRKPDPNLAERAMRIRDMQGKLAGLPPDIAGRLGPALMQAAQLLRDGRFEDVDNALRQVTAVLARLQVGATPKPPPQPVTPQPVPQPPPPDPRMARLREALAALRTQASALPETGAAAILSALDRAGTAIDSAEAEAALAAMKEAQAALKAAQEARARWDKAFALLEGPVLQALKGSAAGDLRQRWDFAVALAAEGHWHRALAAVPQIAAAVRQAATAPQTPRDEVPRDVVPFQRSRILWIGVRERMLDEADALRDAIIAQSADDTDHAEIARAAAQIAAEVRQVDSRLQDVLEQITVSPEGDGRSALKRQAAGIIAEYRTLIGSGVFKVIDQNPFRPVSVASSARGALEQISRTLAT